MILIMIIIIFSNDKYARNSGKCTHPRLWVAYICIGGRMRKLMMGGMGSVMLSRIVTTPCQCFWWWQMIG